MSLAIGVDPGNSGAIALVCSERGVLGVAGMPTKAITTQRGKRKLQNRVDGHALRAIVRTWAIRYEFNQAGRIVAAVERMWTGGNDDVIPKSVAQAMGRSQGIAEGVLVAYAHEIHTPSPGQWKRTYGLTKDKAQSAPMARRFVKGCPTVLSHDKAEAVLLAHWALGAIQLRLNPDEESDPDDWTRAA